MSVDQTYPLPQNSHGLHCLRSAGHPSRAIYTAPELLALHLNLATAVGAKASSSLRLDD